MLSLKKIQSVFMKLIFSILFLLLAPTTLYSKEVEIKYIVKTKGIKLGELVWSLKISENYYKTEIMLKDKGLLSHIYGFDGVYSSAGVVYNDILIPTKYKQYWKTKKGTKNVLIDFVGIEVKKITLSPKEVELPRVKYQGLKNYNDPISAFLNILINNYSFNTIDGRRIYLLELSKIKKNKKILIKNFKNIWADHKRNDLEYLEVYEEANQVLPTKINIKFKNSIFSLIKN